MDKSDSRRMGDNIAGGCEIASGWGFETLVAGNFCCARKTNSKSNKQIRIKELSGHNYGEHRIKYIS